MPIYARNGLLLADGAALRGCCCGEPPPPAPECIRVTATLWASSWDIPSGSAAGTGYHESGAEIYGIVCPSPIIASRMAQTWSEFTAVASATSASCRTSACNGSLATVYNSGSRLEASVPATRSHSGNPRLVAEFTFDDSRIVQAGYTVKLDWSLSITFRDIGGGVPGPGATVPTAAVEFVRGHTQTYTAPGADRTWTNIIRDVRTGGQSFTDLTAYLYIY